MSPVTYATEAVHVNDVFEWRAGEECSAPADPGRCKASMVRFYYDTKTRHCKEFVYGGCEGNANRYNTFNECKNACSYS